MSNRMERVEVFWGKIIAGYTHEIKNILATINCAGTCRAACNGMTPTRFLTLTLPQAPSTSG